MPASIGVLDGLGRARVELVAPPGLPVELAGSTLHHAAVTLDGTSVDFASPAVAVTLIP